MPTSSANPFAGRRRLIICCDGTWQASDSTGSGKPKTNVTKISQIIAPADTSKDGTLIPQIMYYQAGIGSGTAGNETLLGRTLNKTQAALDGWGGYGLKENVIEAYYFLVNNWSPDAELYLFGFSRGAYTVRSLAGFITNIGIMSKKSMSRFPEVYKEYSQSAQDRHPPTGSPEWNQKMEAWRQEKKLDLQCVGEKVVVHLIGTWDSVGSLAGPDPFPVKLRENVEYAFQALGLEEHRANYSPSLWHLPKDDPTPTRLIQCWFPGVHGSIGGGEVKDSHNDDMSHVTLFWMVSLIRPFLAIQEDVLQAYADEYRPAFTEGDWTTNWGAEDSYPTGWLKYPKVLLMAGGDQPRSPGQYDENNVNQAKTDYVATDTFEFIHPSVRIHWKGKKYPASLAGFELRVGKERDQYRSGWEWAKKLKDGKELVIPEWQFQESEEPTGVSFANSPILNTIVDDPRVS